MANIYYNPEDFGLEIFVSLDQPNMSYEFNTFAVWINRKDRKIYYGSDSGCSCPSPFEAIDSVQSLFELSDLRAFEEELRNWGDHFLDAQEIQSVVDKVRVAKMYNCMLS